MYPTATYMLRLQLLTLAPIRPLVLLDTTYAVALDSSYTGKTSGTTYTYVKAWNGTAEKVYKYEGTDVTLKAGDVFEYSADGEDTVDIDKCETVSGKSAFGTAKVEKYDEGTGDIVLNGVSVVSDKSKIDSKDTVVLYVDSGGWRRRRQRRSVRLTLTTAAPIRML